jgi:cytochrome c oxidase subunit II
VVGGCIGCHAIRGNPMARSPIGPNLTHVANRSTIGAGLYPNTKRHMMAWIKNAPLMKPGSIMPTIGKGEVDPQKRPTVGNLTDQQIADIVAYLQALK